MIKSKKLKKAISERFYPTISKDSQEPSVDIGHAQHHALSSGVGKYGSSSDAIVQNALKTTTFFSNKLATGYASVNEPKVKQSAPMTYGTISQRGDKKQNETERWPERINNPQNFGHATLSEASNVLRKTEGIQLRAQVNQMGVNGKEKTALSEDGGGPTSLFKQITDGAKT